MSLENAKKLEDLKQQADAIHSRRSAIVEAQRPKAIVEALQSMADYLKSQSFELTYREGSQRGFVAKYKDMTVEAIASKDDESFMGADYTIELTFGKRKKLVNLSITRGTRIDPACGNTTEQKINDYQNRFIPGLEALSDGELDGSYTLFIYAENKSGKRIEELESGKAAIDKLFEGI